MGVSNLYLPALESSLLKQAEADPFGTVTLWAYFNNAIVEASSHSRSITSSNDTEIAEVAQCDLVYAAFLLSGNVLKRIRKDGESSRLRFHISNTLIVS
jgi:hypothetical protein